MPHRRDLLLELLLDRGRLSVDELAAHFGVTGMTIRRDLQALEEQGLLTRTHGGAVCRASHVQERPFHEKQQVQRRAKEAIARKVVSRIEEHTSLYLDTGTTCAEVARLLPGLRGSLRVFTNNLPAALALLGAPGIEVIVPGGVLGGQSPDLTGESGLALLRELRVDLAVVGCDALDSVSGEFYAADLRTAELSRTAQRQAEHTFLCVDRSKLDKRALAIAGRLTEAVTLFTSSPCSTEMRKRLSASGAEVVAVEIR